MSNVEQELEDAVAALYRTISFSGGKGPDWNRLRNQMHPQGHFGPAGATFSYLTVEEFIERATPALGSLESFDELGLAQSIEQYGRVAHVFTSYQSIVNGGAIAERGINSMQFVKDGGVWRCLSMIWDVESPELPLPEAMTGRNAQDQT